MADRVTVIAVAPLPPGTHLAPGARITLNGPAAVVDQDGNRVGFVLSIEPTVDGTGVALTVAVDPSALDDSTGGAGWSIAGDAQPWPFDEAQPVQPPGPPSQTPNRRSAKTAVTRGPAFV